MQASVNVGKVNISVEAEDVKSLFEKIAIVQSTFEDTCCGKCKSSNIRFVVRDVDSNKFYELQCLDCFAKVSYGHHKDGSGMYPKRAEVDSKGKTVKGEDGRGKYLPNKGWIKYEPKSE